MPVSGCRGQSSEPDSANTLPTDSVVDTSIVRLLPPTLATDGDTIAWASGRVASLVADDSLWAKAMQIHFNAIVLDGHVDVPTLMVDDEYDITQRHSSNRSHVDLPRMHEGGLDGAIFSIYVAPYYGEGARAVARARAQIETVRRQLGDAPGDIVLATRAEDVRDVARRGGTPIVLGLEGGHAIAGSPDTLRALAAEGIRYVTLTHVNTNGWADSSQDEAKHGGLSPLGEKMVRTMNNLGVLVDLAHVSDSTFADAVRVSRAPVIVSHSSCRALTPTVRNVSDEQLRAVAENGGVVMINFFDAMVNPHLDADLFAEARRRVRSSGRGMAYLWSAVYDLRRERKRSGATWGDVVKHIDHAVRVAGIDHVGLGSDFDGVFDLPRGLSDVTALPRITYGLLRRGYSEKDVRKILGGNVLRVLDQAERHAER
ncbi:membrane dipeptidase [Longibacter salinarum]|uniref:Membrane dipeptidase n=1 Tax=Longibacter salinarum TaxID=1850348 RepID=A0A2A8D1I8_9BACT|nr:dipeptidase [Longibacter salinarum]PEN14677.1 membrane dipeptidase [Longibacter salinarum]